MSSGRKVCPNGKFHTPPIIFLADKIRFVTVENIATGETFVDQADVVISARGTLNDINWPDIPGLKDMQIPVMHSADWKQECVSHQFTL